MQKSKKTPQQIEKQIEERLVRKVEDLGGIAWKLTCPGTVGVPDRMVLLQGFVCFVELKRPGEDLRRIQEWRVKQIRDQGFPAIRIRSNEEVDGFIEEVMKRCDLKLTDINVLPSSM